MRSLAGAATLPTLIGDICALVLSLWLALFFREGVIPSFDFFLAHFYPFLVLWIVWIGVFFIAGLYERQLVERNRDIAGLLLKVQIINILFAAVFFFLIPVFGLAPKTILFIYLSVSLVLLFAWRAILLPRLIRSQLPAIVIGSDPDSRHLASVLTSHHNSNVAVIGVYDDDAPYMPQTHGVRPAVVISQDERTPATASYVHAGARYINTVDAYEEVFGKTPVDLIGERWIASISSADTHRVYDACKRVCDVVVSVFGLLCSLPLYPFIALAIRLETSGPAIIALRRVGKGGREVSIHKFRSMTGNDSANYGSDGKTKFVVTNVGKVLRSTHLDELPQFFDILAGRISLVGPRLESVSLTEHYAARIPHYRLRLLIEPGLSGWAQVYFHGDPHHGIDIAATKEKLSYDLYYLKYRSFILDIAVLLKTVRRVLMRGGR